MRVIAAWFASLVAAWLFGWFFGRNSMADACTLLERELARVRAHRDELVKRLARVGR